MPARRTMMLFATVATIAAAQAPVPAHAEFWLPFLGWAQPVPPPAVDWTARPAPAPVATAPRPQRVATVAPEAPRHHPRVLIIGIGF